MGTHPTVGTTTSPGCWELDGAMVVSPSYLSLYESGELARRVEHAQSILHACTLCPRRCGVNRAQGERGFCQMGAEPMVSAWNSHHGEEPPLSGTRGSGTIFFTGCTARCLFCQNYPISQLHRGNQVTAERLGELMVMLQKRGVHNINFVTPTHFVPQILAALLYAIPQGFSLPLVYNTSGYETLDTLRLLDGIIDIYLPDAKYSDDAVAQELSGFKDYVGHNRAALLEMCRQVGPRLILNEHGIAQRGLIVRHLVLPHRLAGTREVLTWLANNLSRQVYVSLMAQYFPAYRAVGHPLLGRKLTAEEYDEALAALEELGFEEGWSQVFEDEF